MEATLTVFMQQVDKRFGQVDKRFEELRSDMNSRFEQVGKRFEQTTNMFYTLSAYLRPCSQRYSGLCGGIVAQC